MTSLAERLAEVRRRIQSAAADAQRDAAEVQLVVVTKNHSPELVAELYELGERDFGENRDQEASPKASAVAAILASLGETERPRWHFVGQLQTNKVRSVLEYASVLHSLDRVSLLKELRKQLMRSEGQLDCFIQLNLTENPDRGGIQMADLGDFAKQVLDTPQIRLLGLMAVADPQNSPSSEFSKVLAARDLLVALAPEADRLSIGMSGDFEVAIGFGATHLRIGSAITESAKSYA